ncbi:unnamed protein product [Camellia sinensis]
MYNQDNNRSEVTQKQGISQSKCTNNNIMVNMCLKHYHRIKLYLHEGLGLLHIRIPNEILRSMEVCMNICIYYMFTKN